MEDTDSNHAMVIKRVCVCIIQHGKSNPAGLGLERSFIVTILTVEMYINMERAETCQNRKPLSYVCFYLLLLMF